MPSLQPSLEESIVLALFDLVNHMTKNGERMAARAGLTVQQWNVLLQVAGDPNFPNLPQQEGPADAPPEEITASYIAAQRGVTRANIGVLVAALVDKGLVEQTEMPDDRRRKRLSITAAGREAVALIEGERRRANRALFAGRGRAELEALRSMLEDCLERLAPRAATPRADDDESDAAVAADRAVAVGV